jgi:hypothetical protein
MSGAFPRVHVIHLWSNSPPHTDTCPMCGQFRPMTHAVGWCCGPTKDPIGSASSVYCDRATDEPYEVAGRSVCKPCHDTFYGPEGPL